MSFVLFTKASRTVIHSADITFQMLEDWRNVDLNSITKQTLYTMEDSREEHRRLIIQRECPACPYTPVTYSPVTVHTCYVQPSYRTHLLHVPLL